VLKAECEIKFADEFLDCLEPGDALIMLDYQDENNPMIPFNPATKCSRILVIKKREVTNM